MRTLNGSFQHLQARPGRSTELFSVGPSVGFVGAALKAGRPGSGPEEWSGDLSAGITGSKGSDRIRPIQVCGTAFGGSMILQGWSDLGSIEGSVPGTILPYTTHILVVRLGVSPLLTNQPVKRPCLPCTIIMIPRCTGVWGQYRIISRD